MLLLNKNDKSTAGLLQGNNISTVWVWTCLRICNMNEESFMAILTFLYVSLFLLSVLLGPHCLYWLLKFDFFLHDLKLSDHMAQRNQCLLGYSNENGVVSNLVYLIEVAIVQSRSIPTLEFQYPISFWKIANLFFIELRHKSCLLH